MKLSNKTYDILKYIVTIGLPAFTTLWLTLASIWSIPYGEPIGATMGAITVFLGALIGISNANYRKEQNDTDKRN
jgi:hypothetical protein